MKKIISFILALAMMLGMTTAAMAETVTTEGGTYAADVIGTCEAGLDAPETVYSVDITWTGLDFTYQEAKAATWDPVNHKYLNDAVEAGWVEGIGTASVVNHSNTAILANFTYAANSGYETAGMTFGFNELYLGSAADENKATTASNTVTPTGTLPSGTEGAEIGSITVKITKAANVAADEVNYYLSFAETELSQMVSLIVDSAESVSVGKQYLLRSEAMEMNDEMVAFRTLYALFIADDGVTQEELTEAYYVFKAKWENFKATKVYTKA